MKLRSIFVAVLTALAIASPVDARELKGRARVIDGDTLYVGQVKVRVNGIVAPERDKRGSEPLHERSGVLWREEWSSAA